MYDIFFVTDSEDSLEYKKIKEKYPRTILVSSSLSFDEIKQKSFTKLFWVLWNDLVVNDDFDLDIYRATKWDDEYVHVFRNGEHYDGICLFPKTLIVSQREFENRFFTDKKEIDILASTPARYDIFEIDSYDRYLEVVKKSKTNMFWAVWPDVDVNKEFKFDFQVIKHNQHITHIFLNGEYYDGICLFSKNVLVSKKEFEHRFFINKKEIDILASVPKTYNKYVLSSYEDYIRISEECETDMFWGIWPELTVLDNSIFKIYFSNHNSYDRSENHVYKTSVNGVESYHYGLVLFSKKKIISKREFDNRFLINRKEYDRTVGKLVYPRYSIDSYDQYLKIVEQNKVHPMFWCIWPEIEVTDNSIFDFYFDPRDGKYDFDRNSNHVFLNEFNKENKNYNGLMLLSVSNPVSKREIEFRSIIENKQHEILVSRVADYDIVFISYNEPNADENYNKLLSRFPNTKRVHGVKGIHQAHIQAAAMCSTPMIWVVDGDAVIEESFDFSYKVSRWEKDTVHVWRSRNPINNLVYGYGGVKLLPRQLTLDMDLSKPDMTTSISDQFKPMEEVSNVTAFNTDPFNTWKSAFRECAKLSSRTIARQFEEETTNRLTVWCTEGADKLYGEYAIKGALAGRLFGESNKDNPEMLSKINDFEWLRQQYGI